MTERDPGNAPKIRDIPSIQALLGDVRALALVRRLMPILRPMLRLLGANVKGIDRALSELDEGQAELLASLPDRFNDLFVERGWVYHESLNFDVAKRAVERGESGALGDAEAALLNEYSDEEVARQLTRMHGVGAFRSRMRLAELALADFKEGRYHASVPIILALTDGLVNELSHKKRGFFSKDAELTAWDSVTAHEKGLARASRVLSVMRTRTNVDRITMPYRNGILHGMDLAYDSREVAVKTWVLLFAVRDLAARLENPPEPKREVSWRDILGTIAKNEETKRRLRAWKPRTFDGVNVPRSGREEDHADGSPERAVVEFLSLWTGRNFGMMAKRLAKVAVFRGTDAALPRRVREVFEEKALVDFAIEKIEDIAPAISEIDVRLRYLVRAERLEHSFRFRLICEGPDGEPAVRGEPLSQWRFVTWEVWEPVEFRGGSASR